jgi:hypothetical protein
MPGSSSQKVLYFPTQRDRADRALTVLSSAAKEIIQIIPKGIIVVYGLRSIVTGCFGYLWEMKWLYLFMVRSRKWEIYFIILLLPLAHIYFGCMAQFSHRARSLCYEIKIIIRARPLLKLTAVDSACIYRVARYTH